MAPALRPRLLRRRAALGERPIRVAALVRHGSGLSEVSGAREGARRNGRSQAALTSEEPELPLGVPPDWPPLEAISWTSALGRLAKLPGLLLSAICGIVLLV